MSRMGKYCKAFLLSEVREFPAWTEKTIETIGTIEVRECVGTESENQVAYVHENTIVTADVFQDEKVLFDATTNERKAFCEKKLGLIVPK